MADGGLRRAVAKVLVPVVGLGGLVVLGGPDAPEPELPSWLAELERDRKPVQARDPGAGSPAAGQELARSAPAPVPEIVFPEPARWRVALGAEPLDSHPVQVAARNAADAGRALWLEVYDRVAARQVGASGFVLTMTDAGPRDGPVPVELSIDYSGFANAYGGGYGDRLRVLGLPDCALAEPRPVDCTDPGTPLPVQNDPATQTLAVEVADVAEAGVLAVTSAVGGDTGTFAATPLSITGSWQVSPGSGEFGYSYPIELPAPPGGSPPSVGLSYSSGAIDGLTLGTNTQASPSGLGWSDFANAFIERRYEPCFRHLSLTDLCWKSDNATISLAGVSGPLIPVNEEHTEWRVRSDPGWRIERLTGAPHTDIYEKQWWQVTGPDGTKYIFGRGIMPGHVTNSILSVPVIADNPGEPCHGGGTTVGSCQQGWRWYLDRVIDPDHNMTFYVYERQENWYAGIGGWAGHVGNTRYHTAAMLKHIYYGGRDWESSSHFAAHVEFGLEWRCYYLVAVCPGPAPGHTGFPDVPTDLICAQGKACTVYAPSFFNARRYSYVRTEVRVGGEWKYVAQHNIIHSFGDGMNGVAWKLQLDAVQHAAIAFGKLNAYPLTSFTYAHKDNRVDHDGLIPKAMRHNRLVKVTNPFGGSVTVTYGLNRICSRSYALIPPPHWDRNLRNCFPQAVKDGAHLRTGVFHKYMVSKVVESPGLGSPDLVTTYTYEEDPAWAFDNGAFARDEDEFGWSHWRGYGTMTVTQGTSKTQLRLFRGWDDDLTLQFDDATGDWVARGERNEEVRTFDEAQSYPDHHALAGRVLEERRLDAAGSVLESRVHEYEQRITFDPGPDFLFKPTWVGLAATTETVYSSPTEFRQRRSRTTYNHVNAPQPLPPPQPTETLEEGWLDVTGDERCSITTYADNPDAGMYVYPAANRLVAGSCTSTSVLSLTETYYDGSTVLGAPPTRGNPTSQRTVVESGRWSETTTEYDEFGRPVQVTDPTGAATTTGYAVTAGAWEGQIPTRIAVTNALGHQTVTDYHPEFGVPSREVDVNGNVTDYWYDEFGRLIAVWLPTEPVDFAEPSWKFTYDVVNRVVRSQRLTSDARCCEDAVFEETWVIYDGFWRERQVHGRSPASGKVLVAETTYDERGQVRDETVEQALPGSPGRYLGGGSSWLNRTRHLYDELGREIRTEWFQGAMAAHATTTEYGIDLVTVTGPDGRQVRERVDGLGRTVSVEEFDGQAWVSSSYRYDLADRLLSVTDPAGNRIDYTVNLAGWRTAQQDPNRGGATFTHDDGGRQTSATDARGNRVHTGYDQLGRAVERRAGSATGQLLASWQYDTAPGGIGRLHRETAHTAAGDWVSEVVGYDIKGRPTGNRLVVPAGIPGLSGSYTVSQTYDRADRVRTTTYPAIGGLPAETVTTMYNNLGLPTRLAGLDEYVWGAVHDDRGRLSSVGLGPRPGGTTWMARHWQHDADQRLSGTETSVNGSVVSDHELAFDPAGNLTEKLTRQHGLAWRECYGYDARNRLTSAHTVDPAASCATGSPGTGDRPYVHSYGYSPDGKLLTRVENGADTTYHYPAAGADRPHAPTRIGDDTYSWDAAGSLASRTVAGDTETFAWDVQGMLASVTGSSGTTGFVYDPSGQRLLRRTPDGRVTLYVVGHEITADASGAIVAAVRPYTFDGRLVATRTLAGVEYLVSDVHGSVELAYPAGGSAPSATRAYQPYGSVRAQTGGTATDRGFIGQVEDASTGLSYLNARYYDAESGVFISTDPVYDTSRPKTLNPYSYSVNNPTTFADPSGLYSMYAFGVERENAHLRQQNKQLVAHIGKLSNHIEYLQDIIRKQQSDIKRLLTYARALEAEIARQASIIRRLQADVVKLRRIVWAQRREISRLRGIVAYQAGVIGYYKGVVNQLAGRLWGEGTINYYAVTTSIHSLRGIPAGAFDVDRIAVLSAENATLRADIGVVTGAGMVRQEAWDWIHENRALGATEQELTGHLAYGIYLASDSEARAQAEYGRERYEAGYDAGYEAGERHYDGGDFARDTACWLGGNAPQPGGFVVSTGCYIGGVADWP